MNKLKKTECCKYVKLFKEKANNTEQKTKNSK